MMRLDKALADRCAGSRKEVGVMIRKGRVTVGGSIVKDPSFPVSPEDEVCLDGAPLDMTQYEYLMLNKPAGVVTATEDRYQKTVIDLLPPGHRRDLFPAGRLDKDTTGLLILTNDGTFAHRMTAPGKHVVKEYRALLDKEVTEEDIRLFREGLRVDEEFTALPAGLATDGDDHRVAYVRITEGKYHQVKRMFAAVGKNVLSLRRMRIGGLMLDPSLKEGESRALTEDEKEILFSDGDI